MAKKTTPRPPADPPAGEPVISEAPSPAAVAAIRAGTRCMFTLTPEEIHVIDMAVLVDGLDRSRVVGAWILAHRGEYHAGRSAPPPPAAPEE